MGLWGGSSIFCWVKGLEGMFFIFGGPVFFWFFGSHVFFLMFACYFLFLVLGCGGVSSYFGSLHGFLRVLGFFLFFSCVFLLVSKGRYFERWLNTYTYIQREIMDRLREC